jgi:chromosome segregation ATPase
MSNITVREVMLSVDSLREATELRIQSLTGVMVERDRLYAERSDSANRAVLAAFSSSEKAIEKAETAQTAYNVRSNEFRASLDDAQKNMLSRTEAQSEFRRVEERCDDIKAQLDRHREALSVEIKELRESRDKSEGKSTGVSATIGLMIAVAGLVGGTITAIVLRFGFPK